MDAHIGKVGVCSNRVVCRLSLLLEGDILDIVPPIRYTCSPTELVRGDVALEVGHYAHHITAYIVHCYAILLLLTACEVLVVRRSTAVEAHKRIHLCEDVGGSRSEAHLRDKVLRIVEEVELNLILCCPREIHVELVAVTRVGRTIAVIENLAQGTHLEACVAIVTHRWEWSKVPALLYGLLLSVSSSGFDLLLVFTLFRLCRGVERNQHYCCKCQCKKSLHS